jgi:hypothetical protein
MRAMDMKYKPHFSLRTMLILVTLVCVYITLWRATTIVGVRDVNVRFDGTYYSASAKLPLILTTIQFVDAPSRLPALPDIRTHYIIWFYGWIVELPLTTLRPWQNGDSMPIRSNGGYDADRIDPLHANA